MKDEYEYVSDDGELKIDEFPIRRKKNTTKRDLSCKIISFFVLAIIRNWQCSEMWPAVLGRKGLAGWRHSLYFSSDQWQVCCELCIVFEEERLKSVLLTYRLVWSPGLGRNGHGLLCGSWYFVFKNQLGRGYQSLHSSVFSCLLSVMSVQIMLFAWLCRHFGIWHICETEQTPVLLLTKHFWS